MKFFFFLSVLLSAQLFSEQTIMAPVPRIATPTVTQPPPTFPVNPPTIITTLPVPPTPTVSSSQSQTCSKNCEQNIPRVQSLADLSECFNAHTVMNTQQVARCQVQLACYLGRNPTKLEFLKALGLQYDQRGFFDRITCLNDTESTQVIPPPSVVNGQTHSNALRCIAGIFNATNFENSAAWCSFTTLDNDDTIECATMQSFEFPNGCGTRPIGIELNHTCEKLESILPNAGDYNPVDPKDRFFNQMTSQAIGSGQGNCTSCHVALGTNIQGEPCYKFPFKNGTPLCPLRTLRAVCTNSFLFEDAICEDGSEPKCGTQTPKCKNGSTPTCTNSRLSAQCVARLPSIAIENATGGNGEFCDTLGGIIRYRQTVSGSNQTTNNTFLNSLIETLCTAPVAPPPRAISTPTPTPTPTSTQ